MVVVVFIFEIEKEKKNAHTKVGTFRVVSHVSYAFVMQKTISTEKSESDCFIIKFWTD